MGKIRGHEIRPYADLYGANFYGADLRNADLRNANLYCANLRNADLRGANLRNANLRSADLYGANLEFAKLPGFQIPQEGELIVWKKLHNDTLCKLRIPKDSRRTASLVGRKCRAEFAEVIQGEGFSKHRELFEYREGCIVRPEGYSDDIKVECAPGIHFFLTKEEAIDY